jgi:hypothetical protein
MGNDVDYDEKIKKRSKAFQKNEISALSMMKNPHLIMVTTSFKCSPSKPLTWNLDQEEDNCVYDWFYDHQPLKHSNYSEWAIISEVASSIKSYGELAQTR